MRVGYYGKDYNPEQQAQIVQDWFSGASRGTNGDSLNESDSDPRYRFIVEEIRGEPMPLNIPTHEDIEVKYKITQNETLPPLSDYYLLTLLKRRYQAHDVAGYGGRVKDLEQAFKLVDPAHALRLIPRFQIRRTGDKVSEYFHDHLSTATRVSLVAILQQRAVR